MTIHVLHNRKAPDAWRELNRRGLAVNPKTGRVYGNRAPRYARSTPINPDGPDAAYTANEIMHTYQISMLREQFNRRNESEPKYTRLNMNFQVTTVYPELASQWLKRNIINRPYDNKHAEKIAYSIRNGEWVLNGETICFDRNFNLLDGQHRLSAIVKAGIPVQVLVVTGVSDPSAFETYDSVQKKRGAWQISEMKGVKKARQVSSAARIVMAWQTSMSVNNFHRKIMSTETATPRELSDLAVEISHEVEKCEQMLGRQMLKMSRVGAGLLGILVILNRIDPMNTKAFLEKVCSGVVDRPKDPALVYRDRMISGNGLFRNERRWRIAAMAMTVKAWNAHKRGADISILKFKQDGESREKFPAPIGANFPDA